MQRLFQTFTIGVLSLVVSTAAWAQATAQINGRVTDESGAVLPGVTVTVAQTDTGFTRTVVTDGEGAYRSPTSRPVRIGWRPRSRDFAPTCRPASSCRSAARRRSTSR